MQPLRELGARCIWRNGAAATPRGLVSSKSLRTVPAAVWPKLEVRLRATRRVPVWCPLECFRRGASTNPSQSQQTQRSHSAMPFFLARRHLIGNYGGASRDRTYDLIVANSETSLGRSEAEWAQVARRAEVAY